MLPQPLPQWRTQVPRHRLRPWTAVAPHSLRVPIGRLLTRQDALAIAVNRWPRCCTRSPASGFRQDGPRASP